MRHDGLTWEIDVFEGENAGLVIAEVELEHEDQSFARPPWVGREITRDEQYSNTRLAQRAYRSFAAEGTHDGGH